MARCWDSRKKNRSAGAARRTEGLGRLKDEQPRVGPKGAASGTMQINGCRRQARRASRVGRTSNQIDGKIDEIIDMPVQSYSSGMQVRLGLAVATALDPDV